MKDNLKPLMSSEKHDWETPFDVFNPLCKEFCITLDVCATSGNTKCDHYYSPTVNSLSLKCEWKDNFWMNPPYGREISKWIRKAFEQPQLHNNIGVCLLPARTDTAWFHDYCTLGEIRFIRGRIQFVGAEQKAPFPCMIVIFRKL